MTASTPMQIGATAAAAMFGVDPLHPTMAVSGGTVAASSLMQHRLNQHHHQQQLQHHRSALQQHHTTTSTALQPPQQQQHAAAVHSLFAPSHFTTIGVSRSAQLSTLDININR
jgi:hypothetical protein